MVTTNRKTAFIVSHTHWDREWYLPFQQFRLKLIGIMEKILAVLENDPAFEHFVLDGQAIILEDYLDIHPENKSRIQRLVVNNKLSIGPWYILPDEFLVSGEATVRNLLIGHQVCEKFGRSQKVGYMPDSFGHIAQIPQLLRLADLDSFIYTRGNGDELDQLGSEFIWQAPDGSEVLAVNQSGSYCNAAALGFQEIWEAHTQRRVNIARVLEQIRELLEKIARFANGGIYLLNNGCDHLPPQQNFAEILSALRAEFPDVLFIHSSFETYIQALQAARIARKKFSGELGYGKYHFILTGVWSTRMYLKQQNDQAQTLMEKYLEPLSAYCHFALGQPYPQKEIQSAWKLLLQNHPHDSICGCSIDPVHQEMESRLAGVIHTATQLIRHQMENIAPLFARQATADADIVLTVLNSLPWQRSEVVERLLILPKGMNIEKITLLDGQDNPIPFQVIENKVIEGFWGIDYGAELFSENQRKFFSIYLEHFGKRIVKPPEAREHFISFVVVQFFAENIPALGHQIYYLKKNATDFSKNQPAALIKTSADAIENQYYRIRCHRNGTFDVLNKKTGRWLTGLNRFEDSEDAGDEYDYSRCEHSQTVYSDHLAGAIRVVENTGWRAKIEMNGSLLLPKELAPDRKKRSGEAIDCPIRIQIELEHGSPVIRITTEFDNRVRDHRLRVLFPTTCQTDTVISDGHFYCNRRPVHQPAGMDWLQPPAGTFPQCDFSLAQDAEKGLALLNKGLPEIEALLEENGTITLALTLLRSVGWLSRDDLPARKGNAGPTIFTPTAQCPGLQRFEYALVPFSGDFLTAEIKRISQQYKVPLLVKQGVTDQHIPAAGGFLRIESNRIGISAIKKHEHRDTLVLRLYNLAAENITEILAFSKRLRSAWRTNLFEQRLEQIQVRNSQQLGITLKPHEILNLEIELG